MYIAVQPYRDDNVAHQLTADARAVLAQLKRPLGNDADALMTATGLSSDAFERAALDLRQRGMVKLSGPPNANADLGYDVDQVELTALGYMTTQHEL